jgi:signal transduction histidine kinase
MAGLTRGKSDSLLENYCSRLGILLEHRYYGLALLEAKQQAEKAAKIANEAMLKAQAADSAKSKFLANMAHELRTPLNAIIGFSEIIKLDNIKNQRCYPEYGKYIHEAGTHLLAIIADILDIARIEAGKVELQAELVSLDRIVDAVINTLGPSYQKKLIEVKYEFAGPSLQIYVDPLKFKQVLLNLLSNSIKFTNQYGKIMIKSIMMDDGKLMISITDTGIGIPSDQIEKVLEPFEQVEDYLTRENDGTGLGLPIARGLIRLHGGELVLNSEPGAGTTAFLRLPRDRVHCAAPTATC